MLWCKVLKTLRCFIFQQVENALATAPAPLRALAAPLTIPATFAAAAAPLFIKVCFVTFPFKKNLSHPNSVRVFFIKVCFVTFPFKKNLSHLNSVRVFSSDGCRHPRSQDCVGSRKSVQDDAATAYLVA